MNKNAIIEYGAKELDREHDKELIDELIQMGWVKYNEGFSASCCCCRRIDGSDEFNLSGSQYTKITLVYDPKRWQMAQA